MTFANPRWTGRSARKKTQRVLLALVAILLAAGTGELLLRLTLPRDRFSRDLEATYRPDPVLLRGHMPGSTGHSVAQLEEDGFDVRFRYDQHGMRGQNDFLDDPHPDLSISRVMLLGDSFVEQRQLADGDLIQTHLERMLSQRNSSTSHVFAYGVRGWSPIEYALYYRTQARRFRPNVLFVFLVFNDYRDDLVASAHCQFAVTGEVLACPASSDDYREAINRAEPSSWMLIDLYRHFKNRPTWKGLSVRDLLRNGYRAEGSDDLLRTLDPNQMDSTLLMVGRSFGFLRELFDLAKKDGTRPVLVIVPWPQQVAADEWGLGRQVWGVPVNRMEPSTVFQDVTTRVAREAGIETLDLLPVLRDRAARDRMFFPFDGHFTAAATRSIAAVLTDTVLKTAQRPAHQAPR